jgi:hypothetical protein
LTVKRKLAQGHGLPAVHGDEVLVEYRVTCTRCEIHFTDSRGRQKNGGEKTTAWRHREIIPTSVRSVSVLALPTGEGDRVTGIQIYVEETQVSKAYLPPGGITDPVELTASIIMPQDGGSQDSLSVPANSGHAARSLRSRPSAGDLSDHNRSRKERRLRVPAVGRSGNPRDVIVESSEPC